MRLVIEASEWMSSLPTDLLAYELELGSSKARRKLQPQGWRAERALCSKHVLFDLADAAVYVIFVDDSSLDFSFTELDGPVSPEFIQTDDEGDDAPDPMPRPKIAKIVTDQVRELLHVYCAQGWPTDPAAPLLAEMSYKESRSILSSTRPLPMRPTDPTETCPVLNRASYDPGPFFAKRPQEMRDMTACITRLRTSLVDLFRSRVLPLVRDRLPPTFPLWQLASQMTAERRHVVDISGQLALSILRHRCLDRQMAFVATQSDAHDVYELKRWCDHAIKSRQIQRSALGELDDSDAEVEMDLIVPPSSVYDLDAEPYPRAILTPSLSPASSSHSSLSSSATLDPSDVTTLPRLLTQDFLVLLPAQHTRYESALALQHLFNHARKLEKHEASLEELEESEAERAESVESMGLERLAQKTAESRKKSALSPPVSLNQVRIREKAARMVASPYPTSRDDRHRSSPSSGKRSKRPRDVSLRRHASSVSLDAPPRVMLPPPKKVRPPKPPQRDIFDENEFLTTIDRRAAALDPMLETLGVAGQDENAAPDKAKDEQPEGNVDPDNGERPFEICDEVMADRSPVGGHQKDEPSLPLQ